MVSNCQSTSFMQLIVSTPELVLVSCISFIMSVITHQTESHNQLRIVVEIRIFSPLTSLILSFLECYRRGQGVSAFYRSCLSERSCFLCTILTVIVIVFRYFIFKPVQDIRNLNMIPSLSATMRSFFASSRILTANTMHGFQ